MSERHEMEPKRVIREIVLSSVYRQSSELRKADGQTNNESVDPSNRWLSRGPRLRLSAEVVRDTSLAIAGLLDRTVGGAPVHPPIPDGVWTPFQGGDKWDTPAKGTQGRYRRSIYTYTKRSIPYPMFAAFDAPSREFCTSRRLISNTPIQALTTLNETTFVEAAEALGKQLNERYEQTVATGENTPSTDSNKGIDKAKAVVMDAVVRVLGRKPTDREMVILIDFWQQRADAKGPSGHGTNCPYCC